jgi:N-glycosylase/DNA lyase
MSLHPIDRQKPKWTNEDLERMMIFCMLDRAQPYEKVCKIFDTLNKADMTTRLGLWNHTSTEIVSTLKTAGHRFPNQTTKFLKGFSESDIDLRTATRDELVRTLSGIGYKLASMFLRNTRGEEYAVLDIHVKRWLKEKGIPFKKYKDQERAFLSFARAMGKTPYELDMEIWQERRIGNKKLKSK